MCDGSQTDLRVNCLWKSRCLYQLKSNEVIDSYAYRNSGILTVLSNFNRMCHKFRQNLNLCTSLSLSGEFTSGLRLFKCVLRRIICPLFDKGKTIFTHEGCILKLLGILKVSMRECGNIHVFLSCFCISVHIFHEFLWAFKKLHRQTHSWLFLMKYFLLMQFGTEWSLFCVKPDGSYIQIRVDDLLPLGFHPAALQEERVNTWWCHVYLIVMSSMMSWECRPNNVVNWWCHLLTFYDVIGNVMISTDDVIRCPGQHWIVIQYE